MDIVVVVSIIAYWTLAVVFASAILFNTDSDSWKTAAIIIGFSVWWPITALMALVFIVYDAFVKSAKRIKIDLHNRKLLREFEQWLKERDKTKDNTDG